MNRCCSFKAVDGALLYSLLCCPRSIPRKWIWMSQQLAPATSFVFIFIVAAPPSVAGCTSRSVVDLNRRQRPNEALLVPTITWFMPLSPLHLLPCLTLQVSCRSFCDSDSLATYDISTCRPEMEFRTLPNATISKLRLRPHSGQLLSDIVTVLIPDKRLETYHST